MPLTGDAARYIVFGALTLTSLIPIVLALGMTIPSPWGPVTLENLTVLQRTFVGILGVTIFGGGLHGLGVVDAIVGLVTTSGFRRWTPGWSLAQTAKVVLSGLVGAALASIAFIFNSATDSTATQASTAMQPVENAEGIAIAANAGDLIGTRYLIGGVDPQYGLDGSGFTQYVFDQHDVELPRTAADQRSCGTDVARRDDLRLGDLVFFDTLDELLQRGQPIHVGIYIGDGAFLHVSSSRRRVQGASLGTDYWTPRYLGARRCVRDSVR